MHPRFGLLVAPPPECVFVKWLALGAMLMTASCTPTIYKPDVERLSANIDSATTSFKKLVNDNVSGDVADRNNVFVHDKVRLALDPNCAKIDGFIRDQNECLTKWSLFRQNPSTASKPSCTEPAPFAPIPPEMQQCGIGTMRGDTFIAVPVVTAADAKNHLRLAEALAGYAAQLDAIVSASDGAQLETAAADAGAAAQSLLNKLAAADPKPDPKAKPLNVGPIASFLGSGLELALEARRFAILKNVVGQADPVVQQSSGQLAIIANQFYYINTLQPAYATADNAALRAIPEPSATFPARLEDATTQQQAYLAALAATPGDVFKAVADAHHDLLAALNDPSLQMDALKQSVTTLSEKAKALADVLKAAEAKNNEKSK